MKKFVVLLVILIALVFSACAPTTSQEIPTAPPNESPVMEKYYCTTPGSDNGMSWKPNSQVCYDTQVYQLSVQILGDISSNQQTRGSMSGYSMNGYGSVSGRIWTEGKGIIPVKIVSMNPPADESWGKWLDISLPYILKTVDLGFLGVPAGSIVETICQHDVEVLSPSFSGQTFTMDRVTHELDNCRLKTKNFTP